METIATLVFVLSSAAALYAQQASVTIDARQGMRVALTTELGSLVSKPKDVVAFRLLKPVVIGGADVLPTGTIISGVVVSAVPADPLTHTIPALDLGLDLVSLPTGASFPINVPFTDQKKQSFETRAPAGAYILGSWAVQYQDFKWKKGRKGFLKLGFNLEVPAELIPKTGRPVK